MIARVTIHIASQMLASVTQPSVSVLVLKTNIEIDGLNAQHEEDEKMTRTSSQIAMTINVDLFILTSRLLYLSYISLSVDSR